MTIDRRRHRSADPLIALHYQLSRARDDGAMDTLVLADTSGVVVAGAGSWAACEELAAYAPLFARIDVAGGDATSETSSRIAELRAEVSVCELSIAGQDVLLCARGEARNASETSGASEKNAAAPAPARRLAAFDRAAEGVSRILSAA